MEAITIQVNFNYDIPKIVRIRYPRIKKLLRKELLKAYNSALNELNNLIPSINDSWDMIDGRNPADSEDAWNAYNEFVSCEVNKMYDEFNSTRNNTEIDIHAFEGLAYYGIWKRDPRVKVSMKF